MPREEAIDDHLVAEEATEGLLLGDRPEADEFGTTNVGRAIEQGTAWIPPESPTPEGLGGTASDSEDLAEDH